MQGSPSSTFYSTTIRHVSLSLPFPACPLLPKPHLQEKTVSHPPLTNVCLEDCCLLLSAGVAVHELVEHSDEAEGEDGVILVSAVVPADVMQNKNLLQGADRTG